MNDIMSVGYNRPLDNKDIPLLPSQRLSGGNAEKITAEFKKRIARGSKRPLLGALNSVFFWEFWLAGLSQLLAVALMTLSPLMLKAMINYATEAYLGNSAHLGEGLGLAFGIIAMQLLGSVFINQFLYHAMITGGMARAGLINMIYAKSQVISNRAKVGGTSEADADVAKDSKKLKKDAKEARGDGWSNGTVTNLMSTVRLSSFP